MNILTKFSIGQYVDGNRSWLRIIDSRLKIFAVLIFLITPIWAGPFWRIGLVICLIFITLISLLNLTISKERLTNFLEQQLDLIETLFLLVTLQRLILLNLK